jgi:hypothetical protein
MILTISIIVTTVRVYQMTHQNLRFYFVADFGSINKTRGNPMPVFDALNEYAAHKRPVNFIVSAGDNIYPMNASNPTLNEVKEVINLFKDRAYLTNRVIYTVRGNNDDRVTHDLYKLFTSLYPKWTQPANYYS